MHKVFFTDLDGTLLHPETYSFDAARPALEALRRSQVPLVLCTSKTRAEVELWRGRLHNTDPFIVENGGAIYVPRGYFPFSVPKARLRDGYEVVEFGTPYPELVNTLAAASRDSGCNVLGFHAMTLAEIAVRTFLPVRQAMLAKQREYDEPFEIPGGGGERLLEAIERRGRRWTHGDRFYHITGNNDKALAAQYLGILYRKAFGDLVTVGVGNGPNDAALLGTVDVPVVVRSPFAASLKKSVPHSRVTEFPGPYGWNEAVRAIAGEVDTCPIFIRPAASQRCTD